jgi:outer membrane protein OmpA-like peptidoglycan-associated protein
MRRDRKRLKALPGALALAGMSFLPLSLVAQEAERIDYLTLSQGALVVSLGGDAEALRVGYPEALQAIDGNPGKYVLANKPAADDSVTEIIYELPALTTFDRFAVTDVLETPSPAQTFIRHVVLLGSAGGPDGTFSELARAELAPHARSGEATQLEIVARVPVRWVKLVLSGGLDVQSERYFQDFSEIVGNGTQEPVPLVDHFRGIWKYRANVLELKQEGPIVTGCYDGTGDLQGTVSGNVLRAVGVGRDDGTPSVFVLTVNSEGEIRGVRSSNGAPFYYYALGVAPAGTVTDCSEREVARLGCGSIIHGITFGFDSAEIEPASEPVLADLFAGLEENAGLTIVVEGHTSSEGTQAYNQSLSERRARAVVDDLIARGIDRQRIRAVGKGESEPIAGNDDEAGRSLNRRVEIECAEATAG